MATLKTLSQSQLESQPAARTAALASDVLAGLSATPKTLSPWLFYDQRGSELFERITELPEYYLTRTERGIFAQHAAAIVQQAASHQRLVVIELGAGTASKTGLLLSAAIKLQGPTDYYAIDVSESALLAAQQHLESEFDHLQVHLRVGDYTEGLGQIDAAGARKLVLYIGSSIGNFEPADATALLAAVRAELQPGDRLLLGVDRVKDADTLRAAYNDSSGVTAAFNTNVLARINRELDADFDPLAFEHEARWNPSLSRIEMHLRSLRPQTVSIPAIDLISHFERGETIHTENSYKFTEQRLLQLLDAAGFALLQEWNDAQRWFAVCLAAAV